ncbi:MAG: SHOCT domain-containing protein [Gammaproteobacteria bacterium]
MALIRFLFLRIVPVAFLLFCLLPAGTPAVNAVDFTSPFKGLFGSDDGVVVWQGPGQYVKIVSQGLSTGRKHTPKNDHPAKLKPRDLAAILASLRGPKPEGAPNGRGTMPLFTMAEVKLLATRLAGALARATPRQDVVFAVVDVPEHFRRHDRRSTAARLFMHKGRLNMIFGDVLQPARNDEKSKRKNISHYAKPHRAGKRIEALGRSVHIARGTGINYWTGRGSPRDDWIVIDVPTTVAAYKGLQIRLAAEHKLAGDENTGERRERRHMQEEIARLRQELQESERKKTRDPVEKGERRGAVKEGPIKMQNGGAPAAGQSSTTQNQTGTPAVHASAARNNPASATAMASIEQRLGTLKSLHEKQLITDEEYSAKRKQILDML